MDLLPKSVFLYQLPDDGYQPIIMRHDQLAGGHFHYYIK